MNQPQSLRRRTFLAAILVIGAGGAIAAAWLVLGHGWWTSERIHESAGRQPEGRGGFVGSSKCAECHPGEALFHSSSGHARTFAPAGELKLAEKLDGRTFTDPERKVTYHYHLEDGVLNVTIPEMFGEDRFPLDWALGSGERAVTFLSLFSGTAGETVGVEHRVSWFSEGERLDLTPGQLGRDVTQVVEHFGRITNDTERCIGCHTTTFEIQQEMLVNLRSNVGCESCHGPGRDHVIAMEQQRPEADILFGRGTWQPMDEIQMCGDCHRSPVGADPKLVRRDNAKLTRFQPVGLVQSRCFTQSQTLSCSTCHDPHQHAARKGRAAYERDCLNCHTPQQSAATTESAFRQVACPVSPQSNCMTCHMPPVQVHPGISFHDHWIRVRDESDPPATTPAPLDGQD